MKYFYMCGKLTGSKKFAVSNLLPMEGVLLLEKTKDCKQMYCDNVVMSLDSDCISSNHIPNDLFTRLYSERLKDVLSKYISDEVQWVPLPVKLNNGSTSVCFFMHFLKINDILSDKSLVINEMPAIEILDAKKFGQFDIAITHPLASSLIVSEKVKKDLCNKIPDLKYSPVKII